MNRKELKKTAKDVLKHNYIRCIIVAFVVGFLLNSGYSFTSQKIDTTKENIKTTQYNEKQDNYNLLDEFFEIKPVAIPLTLDYGLRLGFIYKNITNVL